MSDELSLSVSDDKLKFVGHDILHF